MVLSQETSVQVWVGVSYTTVLICEMRITIVTFLSVVLMKKQYQFYSHVSKTIRGDSSQTPRESESRSVMSDS